MTFSSISILLVVASFFGIVAKQLKQPLLVGYLFAGIVLSLFGYKGDKEMLESLSQIGVALLLFLVGLEMRLDELPSIGKVALYTGIGQIIFTVTIGFFLSLVLGFGTTAAIYIAIALTFSSTIIMIKLLSEKKALGSLYGKISIGFLLVQDFVAIIILLILAGLKNGQLATSGYIFLLVKGLALIALVWGLSRKILPLLFEKIVSRNQELLFITSIAWALGVASFVAGPVGFSLEIGGFLAGLALSNLPEHLQIATRTKPLRDFFLTIFFLLLGSKLVVGSIGAIVVPAVIFSLFVLIGNPLIVVAIMGFLGYKRRTSFMAGLTVAQISEFSLILMAMGLGLGHVGESEVALVVLVGVITMTTSTYLIMGAEKVYKKVGKYLKIFERKNPTESVLIDDIGYHDHIVLVGADRTGKTLINYFRKKNIPILAVDFNPRVFRELSADKIPTLFGDINDDDILAASAIDKSRIIISTINSLADNLTLLENIKHLKRKPLLVFVSATRKDAVKLYEKGASYVVVPGSIAGEHMRHLFKVYGTGKERLSKIGVSHFNRIMALK